MRNKTNKTCDQPKNDIADDEMTQRRMDVLHDAFGDDEPRILSFDEIAEIMNRRRGQGGD